MRSIAWSTFVVVRAVFAELKLEERDRLDFGRRTKISKKRKRSGSIRSNELLEVAQVKGFEANSDLCILFVVEDWFDKPREREMRGETGDKKVSERWRIRVSV